MAEGNKQYGGIGTVFISLSLGGVWNPLQKTQPFLQAK